MTRTLPTRLPMALAAAALSLLLASCGEENGDPETRAAESSTSTPAEPASTTPSPTTPSPTTSTTPAGATDGAIDVPTLPLGDAPQGDLVIDGTVQHDGRTIETDLPEGAAVSIMGAVDDLVVLVGSDGASSGTNFWAVDETGRAELLGEPGELGYESYNYGPVLVEETGHIWVNYDDRGSGAKRVWAIDVRTGEEILELVDGEDPPELAPADLDVLDVFYGRSRLPDPEPAASPDGSLVAEVGEKFVKDESRFSLVVRRVVGNEVVRRIPFAAGSELTDRDQRLATCAQPQGDCYVYVDLGTPTFEDDEHLLVAVQIATSDIANITEPVQESWIVRCDLEGRCERATEASSAVSLGVS